MYVADSSLGALILTKSDILLLHLNLYRIQTGKLEHQFNLAFHILRNSPSYIVPFVQQKINTSFIQNQQPVVGASQFTHKKSTR